MDSRRAGMYGNEHAGSASKLPIDAVSQCLNNYSHPSIDLTKLDKADGFENRRPLSHNH